MLSLRDKAQALLDAVGYRTEHDRSVHHQNAAASFVSCFRHGQRDGAWKLAELLSVAVSDRPDAHRAAAQLATRARFPIDALAWAWADPGAQPGELDLRPIRHTSGGRNGSVNEETAIGAVARFFAAGSPQGIHVVSGPSGTGKTVANVFAGAHHGGCFIRAAALGEIALGDGEELKKLAHEPLLIIDELGRESDIRPTPARITELLGSRHDQRLATLITTQLTRRHHDDPSLSFEGRYGGHILNRIESAGLWSELRQPSRRSKMAPKLSKIRNSCRIDELLRRIDAGGHEVEEHIEELQRLLETSDEEIERAFLVRNAWRKPLIERAASIGGIAGDIILAALGAAPGTAPDC